MAAYDVLFSYLDDQWKERIVELLQIDPLTGAYLKDVSSRSGADLSSEDSLALSDALERANDPMKYLGKRGRDDSTPVSSSPPPQKVIFKSSSSSSSLLLDRVLI